jgi:RNA polymerase sigma-70 factor (ECF subfamily)
MLAEWAEGWVDVSDADLIEQSIRDPECFAEIFDRYGGEILRYVQARLGPELAQDVTAETFLAAFRHRERFDPAFGGARPWLYGIATRQIGKQRRTEARRLRLLRSAAGKAAAEAVTADFSGRAAERVTAEGLRPRLARLLAAMAPLDRELLLLVAWGGLSYQEAAAAMGTTVAAAKARLHRIRVRTRTELDEINPLAQEVRHG